MPSSKELSMLMMMGLWRAWEVKGRGVLTNRSTNPERSKDSTPTGGHSLRRHDVDRAISMSLFAF